MINPNKVFNPKDYEDDKLLEIKAKFELVYANLAENKIAFEYSDWNRAWEYGQLILNTLPQYKRVLDVGSGKSLFPIFLSRYYKAKVSSVDVEDVQDRYKLYGFCEQDIDVIKANACELPFKDNEFDVVYMASVIEHISDFWIAMSEASRVCRSGGFIGITTDYTHDQSTIISHKSGKTYDQKSIEDFVRVLKTQKVPVELVSPIDFSTDLTNPDNRAVKGEYTFISLIFKNL